MATIDVTPVDAFEFVYEFHCEWTHLLQIHLDQPHYLRVTHIPNFLMEDEEKIKNVLVVPFATNINAIKFVALLETKISSLADIVTAGTDGTTYTLDEKAKAALATITAILADVNSHCDRVEIGVSPEWVCSGNCDTLRCNGDDKIKNYAEQHIALIESKGGKVFGGVPALVKAIKEKQLFDPEELLSQDELDEMPWLGKK
ncbi:MAG: hypothetical protein HQL75_00400 [Magnetococcales bacterium]|nr:hypothetical protein [Magnetococcales bacterium]